MPHHVLHYFRSGGSLSPRASDQFRMTIRPDSRQGLSCIGFVVSWSCEPWTWRLGRMYQHLWSKARRMSTLNQHRHSLRNQHNAEVASLHNEDCNMLSMLSTSELRVPKTSKGKGPKAIADVAVAPSQLQTSATPGGCFFFFGGGGEEVCVHQIVFSVFWIFTKFKKTETV